MKKKDKEKLKQEVELDNYVRELEKSDNVLELVEQHLHALGKSNAALHCDDEIVFSPLYTLVTKQREGIKLALRKFKRKVPKEDADAAHEKDKQHDKEVQEEIKEESKES